MHFLTTGNKIAKHLNKMKEKKRKKRSEIVNKKTAYVSQRPV
jgi:hypothetical protein